MTDFLEDLRQIREREIGPIRDEAGIPRDESAWDGDTVNDEKLMRYIELLEATVVGKASVLSLAGSLIHPHMRRDTREALDGL